MLINQAYAPNTRRLLVVLAVCTVLIFVLYQVQVSRRLVLQDVSTTTLSNSDTIKLKDPSINECSGLAVSRLNPGCFWVHNDSGDSPRLFLVDREGETRLRLHLTGAEAIDWEDLTLGKIHGQSMLVAGDIGGNARQRDNIVLYLVFEPKLDPTQKGASVDSQQVPQMVLRVRVPGGVTNYEGIGFDSTLSSILLMEKSTFGGRIYSIDVPQQDQSVKSIERSVDAKFIARTAIPTATACDISADGSKLVAINYSAGFLFERKLVNGQLEPWLDALNQEPKTFPLPRLRQAESVCFSENGQSIYVSSEFTPTPIIKVDLKASLLE